MKLRKFEAPSVREALMKVKEELGADAVILRTEKVKKGAMGGDDIFEVTAAVDENAPTPSEAPPKVSPTYTSQGRRSQVLQNEEQRPSSQPPARPKPPQDETQQELLGMVRELRRELRQIKGRLHRDHQEGKRIPEEFSELFGELQEKGLQDWAIHDIVSDLIIQLPLDKRKREDIQPAIQKLLQEKIPTKQSSFAGTRAKVLLFIGPTGVGKSTSIAKLAAREVLSGNSKVAIVSTDAYRIGALEQMELFSRAAEVEFRAVFDNSDLDRALDDFADKNLILVDTAGRSRQHAQHMEELREIRELLLPDEVHLVVSASTRDRDLEDVVQRFSSLGISQILFSKIDETLELGVLYNIPQKKGIPISYLCNGQNIPDDLHNATGEMVANLILKGVF